MVCEWDMSRQAVLERTFVKRCYLSLHNELLQNTRVVVLLCGWVQPVWKHSTKVNQVLYLLLRYAARLCIFPAAAVAAAARLLRRVSTHCL